MKRNSWLLLLSLSVLTVSVVGCRNKPQSSSETSKTMLWKISGKKLDQPSYLYGVYDVPSPKAYHFSDSAIMKLQQIDDIALLVNTRIWNRREMSRGSYFKGDSSLADFYEDSVYETIFNEIKQLGLIRDSVGLSKTRPFSAFAIMLLGYYPFDSVPSVNQGIMRYATNKDKNLHGLIPPWKVNNAGHKMDPGELKNIVMNKERFHNRLDRIMKAWRNENPDSLNYWIKNTNGFKSSYDNRSYFINTAVNRLEDIIKKKQVFCPMQVDLVYGKGGVINLLRTKGYKVEPVVSPHTMEVPELIRRGRR